GLRLCLDFIPCPQTGHAARARNRLQAHVFTTLFALNDPKFPRSFKTLEIARFGLRMTGSKPG
ncbi:MAG: hypothetical protein NTV85_33945, partial [Hyphomicrobiales bacterium]|nr:hypothetical protein [Hyphomicrobiales bacterium]